MRLKCIVHLAADRNGLIVVVRIMSLLRPKHVSVADVIFITEDRPHETFRREGSDLHMTVDIFLREALTGTVVTVNTLDDRTLRVALTSVITYAFCCYYLRIHTFPRVSHFNFCYTNVISRSCLFY